MRSMKDEYKMTLRTLWDVNDVLGEMEARFARDEDAWQAHKEDGKRKKPTRAAIVSAILLRVATMGKDEQAAIVRAGMAKLNGAILEAKERTLIGSGDGVDTPTRPRKSHHG